MEISKLLKNLNDKQRAVVTAPLSNLLVLAGAGSGKTRILVYRIAWLLFTNKCSSNSIMAVTFTNKAACEISDRINKIIDANENKIWVGTFHSLIHRLLRIHYLDANLPKNFQILDNEDQFRYLKRLIKTMNLDDKRWPAHKAMKYINTKKDQGLRPQNIRTINNIVDKTWLNIYENYQESCNRSGLIDFSEILLRGYELWLNKPYLLHKYRKKFTNILVDEFQDTNDIQYQWIRILAGDTGRVLIVGDDDQSIYSWRGAQVENIQRFLEDFP
ncbi:MAG: AAA family ATPase, partial [Pantoea sp. Brub]|nr:AAA family ATPase [Pantoea sp. Brub]